MSDLQDFEYDVFLSHNSAQKDWTRALARRLHNDGFHVFFDEWEMPRHLGQNWIDVLEQSVLHSRRVALVLSPDFFSHDWTRFEGNIIQLLDPVGDKGRILPLLHTPCDLPPRWAFLQGLPLNGADPESLEFAFRYQQLVYNLDNSRPFESDFERFKAQHADGKKSGVIPPVSPLPKGSRMPHAHSALFVGRDEELRNLARLLVPGAQGMVGVHATVTGMGGVGKTQLAIEYAHRYGKLYPGGVFWLNMEKGEEVVNEVARCGGPEGMNLLNFDKLTAPGQAATVHHAWEDGIARLLVFDNAEDPELVEKWRPKTGLCSVLITSRRVDWPAEMNVQPLPLETLPRGKSLEMLSEARPAIRQDQAEREAADKVCDRLGDLPIALNVAAAYLRKYKTENVSRYLDALLRQPAIQNDSLKKVGVSFTVSYDKLDRADEIDALAMRLFHLASHFAPVSISRELLATAAGLPPRESNESHRFEDASARLVDLGLIWEEADGRFLLHRLLREFAGLHAPDKLTAKQAMEAVADVMLNFARQENETGLSRKLLRERPHLLEATMGADRAAVASAANLYNELGYHARSIALFRDAKTAFERALKIDEAAFGPDHPEVADDVNNLGNVLQDIGDPAGAKACYERALKIDEHVFGPDHPNVAVRVNNLGSALKDMGDLEGARACFDRALKIDEAAYGLEHSKVAIHLGNLGMVLSDMGNLSEARAHFERALKIDEKVFDSEHPNVARDANHLGGVLRELGDLAGARTCCERALKIGEAALSPDHPDVATYVNDLGRVLEAQGDIAGAKTCYERALRIDEAAFGSKHRNVARDVANLGTVLLASGDLQGAKDYCERALKIGEAILSPEHPSIASYSSGLGSVLEALNDVAGAKACYGRALTIRTKRLGPEHPKTRLVREKLERLG